MQNLIDLDETIGTNVAMKFTLPHDLATSLNEYSEAMSLSKTEVVRQAITQYLKNSPHWLSSVYFFESPVTDPEPILNQLQDAKKGTLLKVMCAQDDVPDRANARICNFIRIKGRKVSFELAWITRPTHLDQNLIHDVNSLKLNSGVRVIPEIHSDPGLYWMDQRRVIYTVDVKYVWDVDSYIRNF